MKLHVMAILILCVMATACVPLVAAADAASTTLPTITQVAITDTPLTYHRYYTVMADTLHVRPCPGAYDSQCPPLEEYLKRGDQVEICAAGVLDDGSFWVALKPDCSRWIAREWIEP